MIGPESPYMEHPRLNVFSSTHSQSTQTNAEDCSSTYPLPLDLLSVEDLDGYFVSRQLMLCTLHLAKTTMAQGLSKNVPGERRERGKGGRRGGKEGGKEGGEVGIDTCIKPTLVALMKRQLDR